MISMQITILARYSSEVPSSVQGFLHSLSPSDGVSELSGLIYIDAGLATALGFDTSELAKWTDGVLPAQ